MTHRKFGLPDRIHLGGSTLDDLRQIIVTIHKISKPVENSRVHSRYSQPAWLTFVFRSRAKENVRTKPGAKAELRCPLYCSGATLRRYPTARQTKAGRMTLPKRLHNRILPSAIVQRLTAVVRKHEAGETLTFFFILPVSS